MIYFSFCNSTYSLYPEPWVIQDQVYVLHLIICYGRIMPRLAELLLLFHFMSLIDYVLWHILDIFSILYCISKGSPRSTSLSFLFRH